MLSSSKPRRRLYGLGTPSTEYFFSSSTKESRLKAVKNPAPLDSLKTITARRRPANYCESHASNKSVNMSSKTPRPSITFSLSEDLPKCESSESGSVWNSSSPSRRSLLSEATNDGSASTGIVRRRIPRPKGFRLSSLRAFKTMSGSTEVVDERPKGYIKVFSFLQCNSRQALVLASFLVNWVINSDSSDSFLLFWQNTQLQECIHMPDFSVQWPRVWRKFGDQFKWILPTDYK